MNKPSINPDNFFKTACYFESALILVAIVFGWLVGINPFEFIIFNEQAVINGIIGTLPLCLIFIALNQLQIACLQKNRRVLHQTLGVSLHKHHWADLFILATIAGISEEILFRGVIQPWMENLWGMMAGILVSSSLFALVHAITVLYFMMALAFSIYLGLYLDYDNSRNLLIPIIIHSLYDFFVFVFILHNYRLEQQKAK